MNMMNDDDHDEHDHDDTPLLDRSKSLPYSSVEAILEKIIEIDPENKAYIMTENAHDYYT
jgi:hypothetical protein